MGVKFNPLLPSGLDFAGDSGAYESSITSVGDWGSPSGGYYTLTIPASTHGKGTTPSVQCFEDIGGGDFKLVLPEEIKINTLGDVSIIVPETPDLRFLGKILIK